MHLCKKVLRGEDGSPGKQSIDSQHVFLRTVSLILKHMSIVIGPLWLNTWESAEQGSWFQTEVILHVCISLILSSDDWFILFYASLLLYYPSIILRCDSVSQIAIDAHFNYIQMANIDKRIAGVVEGYLSVQETNTALSLLAHVCSVLSKLGINHSQWLFSSRSKQQRVQYQGFSRCMCAL